MKKIFIVILFFVTCFGASAQRRILPYGKPNTLFNLNAVQTDSLYLTTNTDSVAATGGCLFRDPTTGKVRLTACGSGGGSQTWQQTLTTGSTLSGTNNVNNTGQTFTWTNGGTGTFKFSGLRTDTAGTLGLYAYRADSSIFRISLANLASELPSFNIFAANGLTAAGGDSVYLGGTLNQPTTINITGTNPLTFGFGTTGVITRSNGTQNYSENILTTGSKNWTFAYTKPAGVFSLGTAIQIDTLNDVIVGSGSLTSGNFSTLYSNLGSNSVLSTPYLVSGAQFEALISSSSSTINLTLAQHTILVNATSGNIVVNLPAASSGFINGFGVTYVVQKTDASGNTVTVTANGSDVINGSGTQVISTQYQTRQFQAASSTTWTMY